VLLFFGNVHGVELSGRLKREPRTVHAGMQAAVFSGFRQRPFFSPGDFCALPFLDKFRDCGIDSLKIEGRMKSADYVATVVGLYRKAIDDPHSIPDLMKKTDADLGRNKPRSFLTASNRRALSIRRGRRGPAFLSAQLRIAMVMKSRLLREKRSEKAI